MRLNLQICCSSFLRQQCVPFKYVHIETTIIFKKSFFFVVSVFPSAEDDEEEGRNSVCKLLEQRPAAISQQRCAPLHYVIATGVLA